MNPETELERLFVKLEFETDNLATIAHAAGKAEVAYDLARAKAYRDATGTIEDRKTAAILATVSEYATREDIKAALLAQRELLSTIRSQIEAGRSLAASQRAVV